MPHTGQLLSIIVFTILLYITGVLAQKQTCCRVKGCSKIPKGCQCPLKTALCQDVTKGILSMGKRTRGYEEDVYRQLEQNRDREHPGTALRTSKMLDTILKLVQSAEQEDEVHDYNTLLNRNIWENGDFNEDLYDEQPNFYAD